MNTTTLQALDTFGKRLKYAMKVRDVSQAELAGVIGLKQQAIFLLCKEKSKGTKHAFAIARYLRVDPEWLILGSGNPPSGIDSEDGQTQDDLFAHGLLTAQERELLTHFRGLTKAQRDEEALSVEKMARLNKELVAELSKTLK
jgi:transcriptional regulator with XRE-family HTH domain